MKHAVTVNEQIAQTLKDAGGKLTWIVGHILPSLAPPAQLVDLIYASDGNNQQECGPVARFSLCGGCAEGLCVPSRLPQCEVFDGSLRDPDEHCDDVSLVPVAHRHEADSYDSMVHGARGSNLELAPPAPKCVFSEHEEEGAGGSELPVLQHQLDCRSVSSEYDEEMVSTNSFFFWSTPWFWSAPEEQQSSAWLSDCTSGKKALLVELMFPTACLSSRRTAFLDSMSLHYQDCEDLFFRVVSTLMQATRESGSEAGRAVHRRQCGGCARRREENVDLDEVSFVGGLSIASVVRVRKKDFDEGTCDQEIMSECELHETEDAMPLECFQGTDGSEESPVKFTPSLLQPSTQNLGSFRVLWLRRDSLEQGGM